MGEHVEREGHTWAVDIPDHPERTDSPAFRAAKATAHKILGTLAGREPYGPGPWQMHHGGSLWTNDGHGWFLVVSTLGIEWSAQFCADPAAVDRLRRLAMRHYARFPETTAALAALGYPEGRRLLDTPVTNAKGVGLWTDSIFNACVPLAAGAHTGVLSEHNAAGGVHHYPKPVTDIQHFKHSDFNLWVIDPESGEHVAVTPAASRGSGDGRVEVVHAPHGTELHRAHRAAHNAGKRLVLPPDHDLARQAFARQGHHEETTP